jgi:UDP-N-acetylmuramoylalanine--D-glutamate ligase
MPNPQSKIKNQKSKIHPPPSPFAGKKVLIMGLGHFGGGIGAAQWFAAQHARVTVTDAAPADKLADSLRALEGGGGLPIAYKLGGHDLADFTSADLLVVNPAVDRAQSPFVQAALRAGVPTTTEINLFLERCPAFTVGITGSVGKSTTTALIHHALQAAFNAPVAPAEDPAAPITNPIPNSQFPIPNSPPRVFLGGNIGRSLLADLPSIRPSDIVVLELSSFMLEETPHVRSSRFSVSPVGPDGWSPNIAVVINLFPNHLDRHHTLEAYAAAKQNILRFQQPSDVAILNADHELVSAWDKLARGTVLKFTTQDLPRLDLVMPGMHNQSNARAALAVLHALASIQSSVLSPQSSSLSFAAAHTALLQFPGLAHRLQCVHTLNFPSTGTAPAHRLRFYNDSKATSPDASVTALQTFDPRTAIFIVGGYDKHLPDAAFETFDRLLALRALAVLGIGATGAAMIARIQAHAAATPTLRAQYVHTLDRAVELGAKWALELGAQALVLSPASASWDQFPNYEKRGEVFSDLSKKVLPSSG